MRGGVIWVFVLLIFLFLPSGFGFEPEICFKSYGFGTGAEYQDFHASRVSGVPGGTMRFRYQIRNVGPLPLTQVREKIQVFYVENGTNEQLLDEFFLPMEFTMRVNETRIRKFTWKIPEGSPAGSYSVKSYLVLGRSWNYMGLSFVPYGPPGVPGEVTDFEVKNGGNESWISFSKEDTVLSGEKYDFGTFAPVLLPERDIKFSTKVESHGYSGPVNVTFSFYQWDSSDESLRYQEDQVRELVLKDGEKKMVTFHVGTVPSNAYQADIVAAGEGVKAIQKHRIAVSGKKARFIFSGLDPFPFSGGDVRVAICASNAADHSNVVNASFRVVLLDGRGSVLSEYNSKNVLLLPSPTGFSHELHGVNATDILDLRVTLFSEGRVMDEETIRYRRSDFVNITGLTLRVPERVKMGTGIPVKVVFIDEDGAELSGRAVVSLYDQKGNILTVLPDLLVGPSTVTALPVFPVGTYRLEATTFSGSLEDSAVVRVVGADSTPSPLAEGDSNFLLFFGGAVLVVLVLFWLWRRRS